MLRDDILSLCKDELIGISGFIDEDKPELFKQISDKINQEYSISQLKFLSSVRNGTQYIIYRFKDDNGRFCKSAIEVNHDTLVDDFVDHLYMIIAGCKAIQIINEAYDEYRTNFGAPMSIEYKWGRLKGCDIAYWDFNSIVVELSSKALEEILAQYDNGETAFKLKVESMIKKSDLGKQNIVEFIREFNNISIHQAFKLVKLDVDDTTLLTEHMISPEDAETIVHKNRNNSGNQRIQVLNIVKQLGTFLVLSYWDVDYADKTINISIVDDQVIDLDSASIISNYAILSRLEQVIDLDANSKAEMFSDIA